MASPVSSIRSAARGTYSAYKRQPIRWRLAGGSAALTLVILLGFAVIVGTLTTQAIYKDFNRQVSSAADRLQIVETKAHGVGLGLELHPELVRLEHLAIDAHFPQSSGLPEKQPVHCLKFSRRPGLPGPLRRWQQLLRVS